jgi:general secretion pathway protein N
MHSHRLLIALLAILCVAFAGVAVAELTGFDTTAPEPSGPDAPALSKIEAPAAKASFSLPALNSFASITERPLFSPNRRPAARSADSVGDWASFALTGIIITPQTREALVSHGKPPKIAHLAEGQTVDGWTVSAIYSDHVVFNDRFNEHELRLIDKSAPPPPRAAPPPPPRAAPTPRPPTSP